MNEAVTHARTTLANWTKAQDQFHEVVLTKYHHDVANSPKRNSWFQRSSTFASKTLARARNGRQATVEIGPLPLNKKLTLKRQNSSPTKINKGRRKREPLMLMKAVPIMEKPEIEGPPRIISSNAWVERQEARNLLPQTHKNANDKSPIKLGRKENSSPTKARKNETRKSQTEHASPVEKE